MWDLETIRRMNDEAVERERSRVAKAVALRAKYELNGQELDVTPLNPSVSSEEDVCTPAKVAEVRASETKNMSNVDVKITATDDAVTVVVSTEGQKVETFTYGSGFAGLTGSDLQDVLAACGIQVEYEYVEKVHASETDIDG